jgi:hypothetical protein
MQLKSLTTVVFQMLCAFSTRKRVRSLCLALLCLWLTLVSCFFLHRSLWSLGALPSCITRFSTPGSTTAFSLHPDPWHPPTCTSLVFALSHSSHWLQSSHPHPSLAAAIDPCVSSIASAVLLHLGLRPLSMRVSRSGTAIPSQAQLFYTVLGAASSRSSACSGLKRALDKHSASSLTFLIRQLIPSLLSIASLFLTLLPFSSSADHSFPLRPSYDPSSSCLNRTQMSLIHVLDLLHSYMAHRNPLLLSTLLSCWLTRDLLLRTCTHSTIHSMLVLTLPFAFFREPPPSIQLSASAHYAIPSLPSPLQWRSPSASLTAEIRPQSPGSVRSVLSQASLSICFSHAASLAIFGFSFLSRFHLLLCTGSPIFTHSLLRFSSSPVPSFTHTNNTIPLRIVFCIIQSCCCRSAHSIPASAHLFALSCLCLPCVFLSCCRCVFQAQFKLHL